MEVSSFGSTEPVMFSYRSVEVRCSHVSHFNNFDRLSHNPNKTIWDLKNCHQNLWPMTTSVCQKKKALCGSCLSWPDVSQGFSKILFPATFPKKGLGRVDREREQPPWTLTLHPHILQNTTKDVDCWTKGASGRPKDVGEGQERPLTWHHYEDNKDIAKNTPGFWWKKVLWKIFP